jgi:hypothetical protein
VLRDGERRPIITLKKDALRSRVGSNPLPPSTTRPEPPPNPPSTGEALFEREPVVVEGSKRRAVVKAVRRRRRFVCVVMGKERTGPTKIYNGIKRAEAEAGRLVAEGIAEHVFVVRIIASAKPEVPPP